MIEARTIDLRAHFEAQLRAVARLEEQLRRSRDGQDKSGRQLQAAVRRELAEMRLNNANIQDVLNQFEIDSRTNGLVTTPRPRS